MMAKGKMQMSKADKINVERIRETLRLERQLWRAEHPGRKFPGYTKEVIAWRIKRSVAAYDRRDKKMRKAWLAEHPGDPLPEHLCELGRPFPGQKRWCAKALRWLDAYTKKTGHVT